MSKKFRLYEEGDDKDEDPNKIPFEFVLYYGSMKNNDTAESEFQYIMPSQLLHYASSYHRSSENFIKQLLQTHKDRLELYYTKPAGKKDKTPSVFKSTAVLVSQYRVPDSPDIIINGFATFKLSTINKSMDDEILITSICADNKYSNVFDTLFKYFQEAAVYDCTPKAKDDDDDDDDDDDEKEEEEEEKQSDNITHVGGKKSKITRITFICDYKCKLHDFLVDECNFATKDSKEYLWETDMHDSNMSVECRRKYFYRYKYSVTNQTTDIDDVIGYITSDNKIVFFSESQKKHGVKIVIGSGDDGDNNENDDENDDNAVTSEDLDIINLSDD